jgi:hypothetical protein
MDSMFSASKERIVHSKEFYDVTRHREVEALRSVDTEAVPRKRSTWNISKGVSGGTDKGIRLLWKPTLSENVKGAILNCTCTNYGSFTGVRDNKVSQMQTPKSPGSQRDALR